MTWPAEELVTVSSPRKTIDTMIMRMKQYNFFITSLVLGKKNI